MPQRLSRHIATKSHSCCLGCICQVQGCIRFQSYTIKKKAKLFDAVITPVVFYGAAGWTLTKRMEQQLTTTRRKMLLTMLCSRRESSEDWVPFIKRTTAMAETNMDELGYESWVAGYRPRKLKFIVRTVRTHDARWSRRISEWRPFLRCIAWRCVGRSLARW